MNTCDYCEDGTKVLVDDDGHCIDCPERSLSEPQADSTGLLMCEQYHQERINHHNNMEKQHSFIGMHRKAKYHAERAELHKKMLTEITGLSVRCCRCKNIHKDSDRVYGKADSYGMKPLCCPRCGGHSYQILEAH